MVLLFLVVNESKLAIVIPSRGFLEPVRAKNELNCAKVLTFRGVELFLCQVEKGRCEPFNRSNYPGEIRRAKRVGKMCPFAHHN